MYYEWLLRYYVEPFLVLICIVDILHFLLPHFLISQKFITNTILQLSSISRSIRSVVIESELDRSWDLNEYVYKPYYISIIVYTIVTSCTLALSLHLNFVESTRQNAQRAGKILKMDANIVLYYQVKFLETVLFKFMPLFMRMYSYICANCYS